MVEREPVDEGRIHEWLDGQLSPAEGVRLEQLVAEDPAWADALAEARGLIAASRRIVRALDEVPGDVLPNEGASELAVRAAAIPSAASRMVADAAAADGTVRRPAAADAVRVISRAPSRRPRFMLRTWRNAAAILVVFVGSGAVLRLTRQTASIAAPSAEMSPSPVAELPTVASAPALGSAASPADAERKSAVARETGVPSALAREADATSARTAPSTTLSPAPAAADAANRITPPPSPAVVALGAQSSAAASDKASEPLRVPATPSRPLADSVVVVADAAPASAMARRAAPAGEVAAPAPPAGPRRESSEKAAVATISRGRELRRDVASALARTNAGAAEERSLSARGVGARCVELALDQPPATWPTAIALEPSRLSNGRRLALARSADPAGRWMSGEWQLEGDSAVVLSALPGVGRARLWRDQLIGADGTSSPVRWVTCTPR